MRPAIPLALAILLLSGCTEPEQQPYTYVPGAAAPYGAIPLNGVNYPPVQPYSAPIAQPEPPPSLAPDMPFTSSPEPLNQGAEPIPEALPLPYTEQPLEPPSAEQPAIQAPPAPPAPQADVPSRPRSDIPMMGFRPLRGKSSASP